VIRELEIIFGHHAIALGLGITREILVFLKELSGVTTRPIVDPVASVTAVVGAAHLLRTATTATATAVLPIVDQRLRVLVLVALKVTTPAGAVPASSSGPSRRFLYPIQCRATEKTHAKRTPDPRRRSRLGSNRPSVSAWGYSVGNYRSDAEWPPFLNAM
jgi:hypothetical protein